MHPAEAKARERSMCIAQANLPGAEPTARGLLDCASKWAKAGCHGTNVDVALACYPAGTLAVGAACNSPSQCQSGYCATTTGICGTCAASSGVGGGCANGAQCAPGLTCMQDKCVPLGSVDVGGACGSGGGMCKNGLVCDLSGPTMTCMTLGTAGTPCKTPFACVDGLACIAQKCATPLATGADCSTEPLGCPDTAGAHCDSVTKKCIATPPAAKAGQPCGVQPSGYVSCRVGACNITDTVAMTGTCPAIIPDGQTCSGIDITKTCDILASCRDAVCTSAVPVCK